MKKTYIKPQTQAVTLFAEEAMLTLSKVVIDKDQTTDDVFSTGKGWSSDNWTNTDED